MSMLIQRFKHPFVHLLAALTGPRMVYGWRNADGSYCPHTRVSTHSCMTGGVGLVLRDHVFIGHFNFVDGSNGLLVDEGVQITNHVSVLSHSTHASLRVMGRSYFNNSKPMGYVASATKIGAYGFIGPHSVIAPGTRIGQGVLVQAHSFVSGIVPDFAILGPRVLGQPATVVGDTRELDRGLLRRHPELHPCYAQWAGEDALREGLRVPQAPVVSQKSA